MDQNCNRAKSNRLVRLMVANWALGWAVGFVCASAILLSNLAGLRDLMMSSQLMLQGLALLYGGFGFTFGGVVCATAIMLLPTDEESGKAAAERARRSCSRLMPWPRSAPRAPDFLIVGSTFGE